MTVSRARLVALGSVLCALVAGCYASHERIVDLDGRPDAGTPVDAPRLRLDAGPCDPFPSFERGCARAEDCSVGVHQIDCCGTHRALGIAERARARFSELEVECRRSFPDCMCAAGPTLADDGSTAASDMPAVACLEGRCVTSFREE